jgi:RHS repeat-associated protein
MISTTVGGVTTQFGYNGDGTRLRQIIAGVPTTYTQDLVAPLPVVLQAQTGSVTTQYLYALGTRPIAQNSNTWEYLLPDALGSVRQIVDANGNVTLAESYEPYGTVLTSTGTASSIFGYAGEQADTTGLIYLRARYMNPTLGIFLARDPWSGDQLRPGTFNGFNYAGGNPVIIADPSGRCYPPLAFLRDIEPAQCTNMDQALLILGDPRSTPVQKLAPGFYVGVWTTSHAMFVVGAGILAGGGVIAWGTRALATAGGAKAAQVVSEHPNFVAEIGNCVENTWNSAQQAVQQVIQDAYVFGPGTSPDQLISLAKNGQHIVAIDSDPTVIQYLQMYFSHQQIPSSQIEVVEGFASQVNLPPAQEIVAVSPNNSLIGDLPAALQRTLAPGGRAIILSELLSAQSTRDSFLGELDKLGFSYISELMRTQVDPTKPGYGLILGSDNATGVPLSSIHFVGSVIQIIVTRP